MNKMEFVGSDRYGCLLDRHKERLGGPSKKFPSSLDSQWRTDRHDQMLGSGSQLGPNQDKG